LKSQYQAVVADAPLLGQRLMMLMFHGDAKREYAYGPANGLADTRFGTFPLSLMEKAKERGWVVISVKNNWETDFSYFYEVNISLERFQ
jgi:hypothetical protein